MQEIEQRLELTKDIVSVPKDEASNRLTLVIDKLKLDQFALSHRGIDTKEIFSPAVLQHRSLIKTYQKVLNAVQADSTIVLSPVNSKVKALAKLWNISAISPGDNKNGKPEDTIIATLSNEWAMRLAMRLISPVPSEYLVSTNRQSIAWKKDLVQAKAKKDEQKINNAMNMQTSVTFKLFKQQKYY